jgi:hypothetical protein
MQLGVKAVQSGVDMFMDSILSANSDLGFVCFVVALEFSTSLSIGLLGYDHYNKVVECWGEGEDATLRSTPPSTSLHQRRQDDWQTYPSSHTSPDEGL